MGSAAGRQKEFRSRSMFEDQRANRMRTGVFVFIGLVWVAVLGFWTVLLQFALINFVAAELDASAPRSLVAENAFEWSSWAAAGFALCWALVALGLYYYAGHVLPRAVGSQVPAGTAAARLHECLRRVLLRAGHAGSPPALFLWPSTSATAFAAGNDPEHGSIVVTTGLLEMLNDEELESVIAHEVAHLINRDNAYVIQAIALVTMVLGVAMIGAGMATVVVAIATTLVALVVYIAGNMAEGEGGIIIGLIGLFLVALIIAKALAILIACLLVFGSLCLVVGFCMRLAASSISHAREQLADAHAALWTKPESLASALSKIGGQGVGQPASGLLLRPLFFAPENRPLGGSNAKRFVDYLLKTHPPLENRIANVRDYLGTQAPMQISEASLARLPSSTKLWIGWAAPMLVAGALAVAAIALTPRFSQRIITDFVNSGASVSTHQDPSETSVMTFASPVHARTGQAQLWLRAGPGTHAPTLRLLPGFTPLWVYARAERQGRERLWYRVQVDDGSQQEGWVSARYVNQD